MVFRGSVVFKPLLQRLGGADDRVIAGEGLEKPRPGLFGPARRSWLLARPSGRETRLSLSFPPRRHQGHGVFQRGGTAVVEIGPRFLHITQLGYAKTSQDLWRYPVTFLRPSSIFSLSHADAGVLVSVITEQGRRVAGVATGLLKDGQSLLLSFR